MSDGGNGDNADVTELRVMADYGSNPLWTVAGDGSVANPESAEVVDPGLAARLDAWAARYDATYDAAYPPDSGFASEADERVFVEDGRRLARDTARAVAGRGLRVRFSAGRGYEDIDDIDNIDDIDITETNG